jgi:hypothetical protein
VVKLEGARGVEDHTSTLVPSIRRIVASADPYQPITDIRPHAAIADGETAVRGIARRGVSARQLPPGKTTRTGKTLWTTQGREGENASLIATGAFLLLSTSNAELIVARPTPEKQDEIRRYKVADSVVWAHPAVVPGAVLVKDVEKLIRWSVD